MAATSISSVKSGNWSDPSVWTNGTVPDAGDMVAINAGHTVTYDVVSIAVLGQVMIHGTLYVSRDTDTRLRTNDNIMVMLGGLLDMGTQDDFIPAKVEAELIFVLPRGKTFTGGPEMALEDTGLWNMGRWETHGQPLLRTWSKLAQDAPAGATAVTVENDATDWHIGGQVVVTQTSRDTNVSDNEVRTITNLEALSGGGTRISLNQSLNFPHQGTGRMRGEVGLLTRNVLVRTEIQGVADNVLDASPAERRFAHTMFTHSGKGNIQYTEFKYMGHLSTLARYPIHQHILGEGSDGKMIVIRGNTVWRSGNRAYQPHDSRGILFEDNVAFDTLMSQYYVERSPGLIPNIWDPDQVPNEIWFVRNLGVQASPAPEKGSAQQNDSTIFWIEQLDIVMIGNVGVGARDDGRRSIKNGDGMFMSRRADRSGHIRQPTFISNEFHSNDKSGVSFWNRLMKVNTDMADLFVWDNETNGILWGYYRSEYYLHRFTAMNNKWGIGHRFAHPGGTRFLQDAEIIGNTIGIEQPHSVSLAIYPDRPWVYSRVVFDNTGADIRWRTRECDGEFSTWPIQSRSCHGHHMLLLAPEFNGPNPIGRSSSDPEIGNNRNTLARVKDHQGLDPNLPDDFLFMRGDQLDPAEQTAFSAKFVTSETFAYDGLSGYLVSPVSALPNTIPTTIWGKNDSAFAEDLPMLEHDWTWEKEVDYPPEISLQVATSGTQGTMTADAKDDKGVTRVEFWVDDQVVATKTSPPYQVTIDLAEHPRKFAHLYAIAYDGHVTPKHWNAVHHSPGGAGPMSESYEQRAYSEIYEVGPEVAGLLSEPPLVPEVTVDRPPAAMNPIQEQWESAGMVVGEPTQITITLGEPAIAGNRLVAVLYAGNRTGAGGPTGARIESMPSGFVQDAANARSSRAVYIYSKEAQGGEQALTFTWESVDDSPHTVGVTVFEIPPSSLEASDTDTGTASSATLGPTAPLSRPYAFGVAAMASSGSRATPDASGDFLVGLGAAHLRGFQASRTISTQEPVQVTLSWDTNRAYRTALAVYVANQDITAPDPLLHDPIENDPPDVIIGEDETTVLLGEKALLEALVVDDDLPLLEGEDSMLSSNLTQQWSNISGPGVVTFDDPAAASTQASFSDPGDYILRLTAHDGELSASDDLTVVVSTESVGEEPMDEAPEGHSLLISSLSIASGENYQAVPDGLEDGARLYIDREYTFSSLPDAFSGSTYIMTANDDKASSRQDFLSFNANLGVTVFVAHDDTVSPKPNWLQDFTPGDEAPPIRDGFTLFKKDFPAGPVTLGGNQQSGQDSSRTSMYLVVVQAHPEEETQLNQPPQVDAGPDLVVTLPDSASLNGVVTDDGLSDPPGAVTLQWSQVSGPGSASFVDPEAAATTASFSPTGTYLLRLTSDDGELSASDDLTVTVGLVYGDANLDGQFTSADVYLVVDWLIGEAPMPEPGTPAFVAADVDGNGQITMDDVDLMIQKLNGEISQFPVES